MDYGTLATIVVTMIGAGVAGLGWWVKLHGDVRVLKAEVAGEIELRRALESRVNGIEERIFDELQAIRGMLNQMASRREG